MYDITLPEKSSILKKNTTKLLLNGSAAGCDKDIHEYDRSDGDPNHQMLMVLSKTDTKLIV